MNRRTYLILAGTAISVGLAGCSGEDGGGSNGTEQTTVTTATSAVTSVADGGEEATATAAAASETTTTTMTETATSTPTPTPSPTPTATPSPTSTTTETETPTAEPEPAIPSTPEATDVPIETPSATQVSGSQDDEFYETLIVTALQQEEVLVSSIDSQGGTVQLSYTTFQTTEQGIAEEMGKVGGAFAFAIGDGWDKDQLQATVLAADGTEIGRYQIQSTWAQQYIDGEITAEEFSLRILRTLESLT